MPCLHIVVADSLGIVFHVVDDFCGNVFFVLGNIVRPITGWLSLKDITIVNEQDVFTILLAQFVDIRVDANHCTL